MYQYNLIIGRIDTFFLCYSNLKDCNNIVVTCVHSVVLYRYKLLLQHY